ncbi:hypothetical protein GQ53DRAFT_864072 [Thozetella sp. PMI_491]|nr:hypothetical protein GQ53DRAFT_864072 [Thozetella sp. PMI_491]
MTALFNDGRIHKPDSVDRLLRARLLQQAVHRPILQEAARCRERVLLALVLFLGEIGLPSLTEVPVFDKRVWYGIQQPCVLRGFPL